MGFLLTDAYMRNFTGALDASCVQSTKTALQTYMYSDATCYAGQVVSVVSDSTPANNGIYLIVTNPSFKSSAAKSASNSPFKAVPYVSSEGNALNDLAGVFQFQGVLPYGDNMISAKVKKGYAWVVRTNSGYQFSPGNVVSYGCLDEWVKLESGDVVICTEGDNERSFRDCEFEDFTVVNKNIEHSVSTSSTQTTDGEIVLYHGTNGEKIKGSGQTFDALKNECHNLGFATGTLDVENGGTGATTLAGAKAALGITALEETLSNFNPSGGNADSAAKLTTARSIAFSHPVLGSLSEYSANTFDGSKNMTALAIDGVYTGTGIPSAVTSKFAGWTYPGDALTFDAVARDYIKGWQIASGSACELLFKQLQRFLKVYVNGNTPVMLRQITDTIFVGETVYNNCRSIVSIFTDTNNGIKNAYLTITNLINVMYTPDNFSSMIQGIEQSFADLSPIFPVGTEFMNPASGTKFIYNGYAVNDNQFYLNAWL